MRSGRAGVPSLRGLGVADGVAVLDQVRHVRVGVAHVEHAPRGGLRARTFLRAESFLQFVVKAHGLRVAALALRAPRVRAVLACRRIR